MKSGLRLSQIPNALSTARLIAAPVLALLAFLEYSLAFAVGLLLALATDALDGWLARRLDARTDFGAKLDSTADAVLMGVVIYAIWPLHPEVYREDGWVIFSVVGLVGLGHAAALLRFGHLASFHTALLRAGILLFSVFALWLFFVEFVPGLLYTAALVCGLGGIELLTLVFLLPEWRADISGGIVEVLKQRQHDR